MTTIDTGEVARFWSLVDRRGPDDCWPWLGYRAPNGYGRFKPRGGRESAAHRIALSLAAGPVPVGLDACHSCDNRPCCNPAHLYPGTRRQNMADCTARGRHNKPRGEAHWCAVLTSDDVREIRRRRAEGDTQVAIAKDFNVHPSTISRIARGEWRKEVA